MNKADQFEKMIKKAVENYEAPFDTSAWNRIEDKLPGASPGTGISVAGWYASAVMVVVVVAGIWYYNSKPDEKLPGEIKKEIVTPEIQTTDEPENRQTPVITKAIPETVEQVEKSGSSIEPKVVQESEKAPVVNTSPETEKAANRQSAGQGKTEVETDKLTDSVAEAPATTHSLNKPEQAPVEEDAELLMMQWSVSAETICQDEEVLTELTMVNEPVEITWDFGDGTLSNDPEARHVYTNPGSYEITLLAKSLIDDSRVLEEKRVILVRPAPNAGFIITKNDDMKELPVVVFQNISDDFKNLTWIFNDGLIQGHSKVEKLYRKKGIYRVGMAIEDQAGCRDTTFKEVNIEDDYNLLAPAAFTPNGDGVNDGFMPGAIPLLNKKFSMKIIDLSNGRTVYETKNYMKPWNGKENNTGALLWEGQYGWTVKFEDGSIYSGTVKLIRD